MLVPTHSSQYRPFSVSLGWTAPELVGKGAWEMRFAEMSSQEAAHAEEGQAMGLRY